jgi:hypothetical protein
MKERSTQGSTQAEGYDYTAKDDGTFVAVSQRTGEISSVVNITAPSGSYVITPDAQQARKEAEERERKEYFGAIGRDRSEKFYFIPSSESFDGLSPADVTRMIYLCTYMNYDGRLMKSERVPMMREDIEDVLGLSHAQTWRFWCAVTDKGYLAEDGNGGLFPDRKRFRKKAMKRGGIWYQKIYVKGVRSLYKSSDVRQHGQIGALFALLPYVNIEHNVLCYNPEEKDLDGVSFMNLRQFCEAIHYDVKGLKRKLRELREITFDVGGHKERFYSVTGDGVDLEASRLFVNPNILYSGTNPEAVRTLAAFCDLSR